MNKLVEKKINEFIESLNHIEDSLKEAVKYSLLPAGKMLRALLYLNTKKNYSEIDEIDIEFAACIEIIHTFSLVHDDLPALDNDDFRRGRDSAHKKFDEATAILSGDTMVFLAFEKLIDIVIRDNNYLNSVKYLIKSTGSNGMIYGEYLDIIYENKKISKKQLKEMLINKTAKFIKSSIVTAYLSSVKKYDKSEIIKLNQIGIDLGLLFQIQDDVLDSISTTKELGKTIGKDEKNNKNTYLRYFGLDSSMKKLDALVSRIRFNSKDMNNEFKELIQKIIDRRN